VGDLANDTAVEGEAGRYRGEVSRDWEIWGANGGYLASIALRAAGAHTGRTRPASITCQFLRPGRFEAIELEVETLRATRRADAVQVRANQGGQAVLAAQVWCVDETDGLDHLHTTMPVPGPPEDVPTIQERLEAAGRLDEQPRFRFWENFDARPLDWVDDWESRSPGSPQAGGWYRFRPIGTYDDPWVDACRSVILADTFTWPAAIRAHAPGTPFIAPSLDLSVQLHHHPADSPWLLAWGVAPVAHRGTIGCTTNVWTADGRLAAIGTGTCLCVPAPAPAGS
jgi:acyl-CoA thioesterase II